jgi:hypothetical protein
VKRLFRGDDFVAFPFHARFLHPVKPGELQQCFVRFRSAVAEKDAPWSGVFHQPPGKLTLIRMTEKIARVNELAGLPLNRRNPMRVAMPQRADGDS